MVVAGSAGGKEPLPPTWDGVDPTVTFPVFEKNVRLWEFESELDEKKRGVRLLRSLTGVARAAADSLEFEDVATQKGVSNIMSCLREHFAPHLEVSLPRAFEKAIYGQPRHHRENLQEYLIRMERAFYLLSKEGVTLPDTAIGYVLFRQASLTEGQELRNLALGLRASMTRRRWFHVFGSLIRYTDGPEVRISSVLRRCHLFFSRGVKKGPLLTLVQG